MFIHVACMGLPPGTLHHADPYVWTDFDGPVLSVSCLCQAMCVLMMVLCRYEVTQKDVTKWQSIVKANREAPTLKFASGNEDVPRTSSTSALTAKFAPSQDYEKEIAAMLEAAGAHNEKAVQESEEALALKVSPTHVMLAWEDSLGAALPAIPTAGQ